MTTHRVTTVTVLAAVALATALGPRSARADRPKQLTVAIFAPTVELSTGSRLALANDVAAAVQARTGIPTSGKAYSSYGDLIAAKPDLAILDPLCIAAHAPGRVLATARIAGDTSRRWGVYASQKATVDELAGKALAYVRTGCRDVDFIDHGVFLGLLRFNDYFSGGVVQADVNGAVVATRDIKKAAAVLAPAALATGLELVLAVDAVPNPGLVVVNRGLDAGVADQAAAAVSGVSGGAIEGWGAPASYPALAGRMATARKRMILAQPERATVSEPDVLRLTPPKVQAATDLVLWRPPAKRR